MTSEDNLPAIDSNNESEKRTLQTKKDDLNLLLDELRTMIQGARRRVAQSVNMELVMMYWHVGKRINEAILNNQRAGYGQGIVATVSR